MKSKFATLLLALTASLPAFAQATDPDAQRALSEMQKAVKNVMPIPGTELVAVQVAPGKLVIMTPNKRFAVIGKVVDVFERKELKTLDDVAAARKVNFKRMGLNFNELTTVSVGSGPKEVVIFADPYCGHCTAVAEEAGTLLKDYTFKFVLLPMVNKDSGRVASSLACSDIGGAEFLRRVKAHDYADLKTADPQCAETKAMKSAIVANSFSVYGVPVIFAPNGEQMTGRPASLREYLLEHSK